MRKVFRVSIKIIGILLLLLILVAVGGWIYIDSAFLNFEKDYVEKTSFSNRNEDGFIYTDLNDNGKLDIYEDSRKSINERVEDLLSQMTIEEKIHILKGSGLSSMLGFNDPGEGIPGAAGTIVPTPRLGLPTLYLADGPAGLRIEPTREDEDRTYYATAFPIGTLLASTWNTQLVEEVGKAMGEEVSDYGIDIILGPGVNIHRHPLSGRNFEYFSEDPVLSGNIGAAIVNGIESQGVGTSVKHFVANNQETKRNQNNVIVSDRAMREIYLKGFEIIVKNSRPSTIMSSYNKVNGTYTSESRELLTDILREEWGYDGVVMTDWFGGENAPAQIHAGNDLLQPGTKAQWNNLTEAYEEGDLSEEDINNSVRRILKLVLKSKKWQRKDHNNNPNLQAHAKITRESATEGMVLLKNNDALPIEGAKNVALIGLTSYDFISGGIGSGDVNEAYTISLEEGLRNAGLEINTAGKKIFEDHKKANAEAFVKPEGLEAMSSPYNPPAIRYSKKQLDEMAESAHVAVITIGRNSGEGSDRIEKDDFLLTSEEKDMITQTTNAFHRAGKKVIVVLNIGGVIETNSWKEKPDAILLAWQGGQESGNSVAAILSGSVNPSGKLPMTFPVDLKDHASNANFPLDGEPFDAMTMLFQREVDQEDEVKNKHYTTYEEDIFVGYRHFDKANIPVSFPFGFGLSYTEFDYSDLRIQKLNDSLHISVAIKNSGGYAGKEVVQFYAEKSNSEIDRPVRELKAFYKTNELQPEEIETINIRLPLDELSYWDEETNQWKIEDGSYVIYAAASSRDTKVRIEFEVN